jgi:hypothetical protein
MPDSPSPLPQFPGSVNVLPLFLGWYFVNRPLAILRRYFQYADATMEAFSFVFLLKTLFDPWKRIADAYPKNMFDFAAIAETFTLNMMTRCIGAVIRLTAILTGIVFQIALLAGFLIYLVLWIAFPVLIIAGVFLLTRL